MLAILASALILVLASLAIGGAILRALAWPRPRWLAGATGFAALVVVAPFLVRLPGRGLTAGLVLLGVALAAAWLGWVRREPAALAPTNRASWGVGAAAVVATLALASLPFALAGSTGVLGQGIYTNDHAAQLYWAAWLADGFGPEPSAVGFGYPVGPQALAASLGELTGASLVEAFNGLLLAIPALTALGALAALGTLRRPLAVAVATLSALPYLAASFLAQSAFKETAMALFLLAFAIALATADRAPARAPARAGAQVGGAAGAARVERAPRAGSLAALCLLLAAAAVLTFSLAGLAWFLAAAAIWLGLGAAGGRVRIDLPGLRAAASRHRAALAAAAAVALLAVAALALGPAVDFAEKIGDVQQSAGRLGSPVFPGEALGVWPEGDFRIVRGEVALALPALALGAVAAAAAGGLLARRGEWGLLAVLAASAAVYLLARPFAEIHVEAKALAIPAPLIMLAVLRSLLAPREGPGTGRTGEAGAAPAREPDSPALARARQALGAAFAVCALGSTLLALRAAPVGPEERGEALERLGARVAGETVAFLGVDRFAGYRLREALARAPAGYVPQEIAPRPEKRWQQGDPADFDSLTAGQLDRFDYAITTDAAHQSTPPPSFDPIAEDGGYVLWQRSGATPPFEVLSGEGGDPGVRLGCAGGVPETGSKRTVRPRFRGVDRNPDGSGTATVIAGGEWIGFDEWDLPPLVDGAAGGQERAFAAPAEASAELARLDPGRYALSLQYHSQVPLEVIAGGEKVAELPANLDGMYFSGAGRGAFWSAGKTYGSGRLQPLEITVRAAEPGDVGAALGAERRVWLGGLAATPADDPRIELPLARSCNRYVDHFTTAEADG